MFRGCTAQFVSDLVGNPEDRFSHNEARSILLVYVQQFILITYRIKI